MAVQRIRSTVLWGLLPLLWVACRGDDPGGEGDLFPDFGGGDADGDGDADDPYAAVRQACVVRINEYRATEGLAPYARWTEAEACADNQAEQDSISDTPHGAFGQCDEWAQNECPGWGSTDQVVSGCLQMMWDEGPGEDFNTHGHYINMSSTDYDRVACGFFTTASGAVWAVQDFR